MSEEHLIDLFELGADIGEVHAVKVACIDAKIVSPAGVFAPNHVAAVKPPMELLAVELVTALLLSIYTMRYCDQSSYNRYRWDCYHCQGLRVHLIVLEDVA